MIDFLKQMPAMSQQAVLAALNQRSAKSIKDFST
jgi:hypothetical protein